METFVFSEKPKISIASKEKRFLNFILDLFFAQIFAYFFALIIVYSLVFLGYFDSEGDKFMMKINIWTELLFAIFFPIYFLLFEAIKGRTLAKYITKTQVVDIDGNKPSFWKIFVRSYSRFIPYEPLTFCSLKRIGWHDRVSKTRVVNIIKS